MPSLVLASALQVPVLLVWTIVQPQPKPDFSGTWHMDATRSDSAVQSEPIGPMTVVITQTPSDIRLETTTRRGKTIDVCKFSGAEGIPTPEAGIARWRGDTLVLDIVRDVRGQSVTIQQLRTLTAGGKEMVVESIVNVQHGYTQLGAKTYGAGKDVFVRVTR
jgi:hypothetical protein